MNLPNHNQRSSRSGVSLFEVLISILVATIGVFGVMVLIPFAVRTADLGLSQDAALQAGQNFLADFDAYGLTHSSRWIDDDPSAPGTELALVPGRIYLVDPLKAADQWFGNGSDFGQFPAGASLPASMMIDRISVRQLDSAGFNPLPVSLAQRLCMASDDLLFGPPPFELAPPEQKYYDLGGGFDKRQFRGAISSMAFVIPNPNGIKHRLYVVVFRGRDMQASEGVFQVTSPTTGVGYGGGDVVLDPLPNPGSIRRNDWLMMLTGDDPAAAPGDQSIAQINFFRVIESFDNSGTLTLQGGDFDFEVLDSSNNPLPNYAVLIPDVLAVYERSIRLEPNSTYY